MTQHVRARYRRHRSATWAVVVVVLAAGALAIVIPALGAPGDPIPPASTQQNVTPTDVSVGGSNFDCTANTGGVPAGLKTFPVSTPPNSATPVVYNSSNSNLPAGVTFTLTGYNGADKGKYFDFSTAGANGINVSVFHAGVKGGNDAAWYNYYSKVPAGVTSDKRLHATLKDPTTLYNASYTVFCYALTTTISGKVYLDRNDFTSSSGSNGFVDVPKAWNVSLFQKVGGSFQTTAFKTTVSSSTDGTYTFTGVPTGVDYKVCVSASASDDSSAWGLMSPSGNSACGTLSSASASTSAGNLISNLSSAATGQDFAVVPATDLFAGGDTTATSDGNYSVIAGTTSDKDPRAYAQQTWTQNGDVFFEFAPLNPCTNCGHIYLLETLKGDVAQSTLSGQQITLKYDDVPPYGDNLQPMPYCQADPRPATWPANKNLATSGVLPTGATSCVVSGSQDVVAGANVHFQYLVYTVYDGGRTVH